MKATARQADDTNLTDLEEGERMFFDCKPIRLLIGFANLFLPINN
jgi:hypothetical protein